ncbi:hypothetical protein PROVALCAL_01650 [Providencia alcalifaciens DSM 30120]|uniref:Uncharacterized protein n=1 Tax=Providencia alcalifaciens DSM 30120 TaxID=520999 RepID=B6XE74_9GAMM|nr:hypothetical protein PROVALCAL_01650 [Providencia alcalifaciens DSM 30120]
MCIFSGISYLTPEKRDSPALIITVTCNLVWYASGGDSLVPVCSDR